MLIRQTPDLTENDVTDKGLYYGRRTFMTAAAALGSTGLLGLDAAQAAPLATVKSPYKVDEELTDPKAIAGYNNFYEFGTDKSDPARYARSLKTRPWTLVVDGLCAKPQRFDIDALMKRFPIEERIYRHRCVEAWSMVVPWNGFPLASLLKVVEPTSAAKFVSFTTLVDPAQMPGQKDDFIKWPYREGLRLDEAMHPLTLLAVGIYGETIPNQNGAPIRLVAPWKYGFKGGKSLVKISLVDKQPQTSWNMINGREYGFYSNVNPEVDHPRWSQATERRIGEFARRKTLPFNGYGPQVASMYSGMDLRKFY